MGGEEFVVLLPGCDADRAAFDFDELFRVADAALYGEARRAQTCHRAGAGRRLGLNRPRRELSP